MWISPFFWLRYSWFHSTKNLFYNLLKGTLDLARKITNVHFFSRVFQTSFPSVYITECKPYTPLQVNCHTSFWKKNILLILRCFLESCLTKCKKSCGIWYKKYSFSFSTFCIKRDWMKLLELPACTEKLLGKYKEILYIFC